MLSKTGLPSLALTEGEMDGVYSYPYTRKWHPDYDALGGVPALEEVSFSITSHRGCFGEVLFLRIGLSSRTHYSKAQ